VPLPPVASTLTSLASPKKECAGEGALGVACLVLKLIGNSKQLRMLPEAE